MDLMVEAITPNNMEAIMRANRLNARERKAAFNAIHPLTVGYPEAIPMTDMIEAYKDSGWLCCRKTGRPGRA